MPRIKKIERPLLFAPPGKEFYLSGGTKIHSVIELRDALRTMSDQTFSLHANRQKNDFARWVRDVLHDSALARTIRRVRTRTMLLGKLDAHLAKNYQIDQYA